MKKSVMLAVVASMLVSANVAMAGFGVKVPGASKPAASSSQQQAAVDVASLVEQNQPILKYLSFAQAAMNASLYEVVNAVGNNKDANALMESQQALSKVSNGSVNQANSVVEKTLKSLDLSKATDAQKEALKGVMHNCKSYQNLAYSAMGAAGLKAPGLLKDATAAAKQLTKNPGDLSKVKAVIATCQEAGTKLTKLQGQFNTLNGKLKGVRDDLGTDKVEATKADEKQALANLEKNINVKCPEL